MRIHTLELKNFRKFESFELDLNPHFTLLVGENASGKTSILDALAVAVSIWLEIPPYETLLESRRRISSNDVRLVAQKAGDRLQFIDTKVTTVSCKAEVISGEIRDWYYNYRLDRNTHNWSQGDTLRAILETRDKSLKTPDLVLPVLAFYGAARAWLAPNKDARLENQHLKPAKRWAAFHDCLDGRIDFAGFQQWFQDETTAAGSRGGRMRPGFRAVKIAVTNCIPAAEDAWYDPDLREVVISINGIAQPFSNLSDGQRMLLAMVGDIAIKAVTQNAFLLPPDELGAEDDPLPRVLKNTPGVVLIDELDVHLHPKWQRSIVHDLKRTFPSIQFVCTSHSPQIIGELQPEEIRLLKDDGTVVTPSYSFGIDSSRVLEEIMGAHRQNEEVEKMLHELARLMDQDAFEEARVLIAAMEKKPGENDAEILGARSLMAFMEAEE